MPKIVITPNFKELESCVRYEFALEYPDGRASVTVFYEVFNFDKRPDNFDGILFALIFHAMKEGFDLKLEGPASFEALINLNEFQLAWSRWLPDVYKPISIESSSIVKGSEVKFDSAISAFSGGVDATFTLLNNVKTAKGLHRELSACLLVHGFDISLENHVDFASVLGKATELHACHGLKTFWVRTNIKTLDLQFWEHSFAAQLVSCLQLFSPDFSVGLVGSSEPYHALVIPWGSNPITDHLLSGSDMRIVHDGAGFSRTEKVESLSKFPNAVDNLRVCWEGERQDRNCGKCEKCIRTKLNLLAVGVQNPLCFDAPLNPADIGKLNIKNDAILAELRSILSYADDNKINESWVGHLRQRVKRGIEKPRKKRFSAALARFGV